MPIKFFSSIFCFLLVSQLVFAKERSIYDLTLRELYNVEVVSAASGVEQKVVSAPANVTVVSKEQWQAMGATSLSEVLLTVAGLHVGQPKFFSYYNTSFTIRGLSGLASGKVKLLVDGLPFENMQVSGLMWGFYMPLSGFERIEVIKGPGSAIYGADAYAGIINLVSEPFDVKQDNNGDISYRGDLGMRVGSFDDLDILSQGQLQQGKHQWKWGFDYSRSNDDPDKIAQTDLQSIFDSIYGSNASFAPGHFDQSYEVFKLLLSWRYDNWSIDYVNWRNFDIGIGTGGAQVITDGGNMSARFERLTSTYSKEDWLGGQLEWQYSYMDQAIDVQYDIFPDGSYLPIGNDGNIASDFSLIPTLFTDGFIGYVRVHGITNSASVTHVTHTDENNFLRLQLGYERQAFKANEAKNFGPGVLDGSQLIVDGQLTDVTNTPFVFIENVDRNFWFISAHQHWQYNDDIVVAAGLRYDHYSDFGSATNPRLSVLWQVNHKLNLKLFAGSAFKAPTIGQLYSRNNPATIGNRNLKEERINTLELGSSLDYMLNDDLILGLNLFRYKAKDLIVYQSNNDVGGRQAQNIGEQLGRGGEFTLKWKPSAEITIDAHYSHLVAEDDSGIDVFSLPIKMAYIGINWKINPLSNFSVSSKWVGSRTRAINDQRPDLDDYLLTSISLSRKALFMGLDGRLTVKNILDEAASEPSDGVIINDFPIDGRQLLFELSYRF